MAKEGQLRRVRPGLLTLTALIGLVHATGAQTIGPGSAPPDRSPHRVRFAAVDTSVRLEVLDWGGTGRAVLFVGCYLTGHVYDEIAPKLTKDFRVIAVTRRGVGVSDRPATG